MNNEALFDMLYFAGKFSCTFRYKQIFTSGNTPSRRSQMAQFLLTPWQVFHELTILPQFLNHKIDRPFSSALIMSSDRLIFCRESSVKSIFSYLVRTADLVLVWDQKLSSQYFSLSKNHMKRCLDIIEAWWIFFRKILAFSAIQSGNIETYLEGL